MSQFYRLAGPLGLILKEPQAQYSGCIDLQQFSSLDGLSLDSLEAMGAYQKQAGSQYGIACTSFSPCNSLC